MCLLPVVNDYYNDCMIVLGKLLKCTTDPLATVGIISLNVPTIFPSSTVVLFTCFTIGFKIPEFVHVGTHCVCVSLRLAKQNFKHFQTIC